MVICTGRAIIHGSVSMLANISKLPAMFGEIRMIQRLKSKWTGWDVWSHKYNLYGLLAYYTTTGYQPALEACKRIGNLLCETFGNKPGQRDIILAGEHVGMAATSVLDPMV